MKYFRLNFIALLFFCIFVSFNLNGQSENNFEISKNLDIYATLLKELDKNYADQINARNT
jgi:hypothetical protein